MNRREWLTRLSAALALPWFRPTLAIAAPAVPESIPIIYGTHSDAIPRFFSFIASHPIQQSIGDKITITSGYVEDGTVEPARECTITRIEMLESGRARIECFDGPLTEHDQIRRVCGMFDVPTFYMGQSARLAGD